MQRTWRPRRSLSAARAAQLRGIMSDVGKSVVKLQTDEQELSPSHSTMQRRYRDEHRPESASAAVHDSVPAFLSSHATARQSVSKMPSEHRKSA